MDPGLRQPIRPSVVAFFSLELQGISWILVFLFSHLGTNTNNLDIQIWFWTVWFWTVWFWTPAEKISPAIVLCDD